MTRKLIPSLATLLLLPLFPLGAQETVDLGMVNRIRYEGFHHSQVMDTAFHLTEVLGPRLTGSPQLKAANDWTRRQLADWGLANAHLEGYEFGRGWSFSGSQVRMIAPRTALLLALPKAWTPGTRGAVRGEVMRVTVESEKDFDQYRGKLAGKILLNGESRKFEEPEEAAFQRYSADDLEKLAQFEIPGESSGRRAGFVQRWQFRKAWNNFLVREKALATIDASGLTNGVVRVTSGGYWTGDDNGVTALVMAAEHYNQLLRLLDDGEKVELEIDVDARYHDGDSKAYNTVAEIPGTDENGEVVMVGAHLDSWHAGTGATDNAAGCVVAMEAVRILQTLGVKPRRTIRIGLWSGEGNALGEPIPIGEAGRHVAGVCLLNDWSARDLQAWEYQPLGPFLAKNFLTSVSPWVVTAEALAPFRIAQPPRPDGDPKPLPYLWDEEDQRFGALGLELEAGIITAAMRAAGTPPHRLSRGPATNMYWTAAQIVAHHASNGCNLRPGDLLGTGTISAPSEDGFGSLLEIARGGSQPVSLPDGEVRTFLEDGDELILSAHARADGFVSIGLGTSSGIVRPAAA